MDLSTIFLGARFAGRVSSYLGLIESLSDRIRAISGSEFDAGVRSLEQALNSDSEKSSLLREARYRFNKSISLESNERLALSYIGLAFCHRELGDKENSLKALEGVLHIEYKLPVGALAKGAAGLLASPAFLIIEIAGFSSERKKLEAFKNSVKGLITNQSDTA